MHASVTHLHRWRITQVPFMYLVVSWSPNSFRSPPAFPENSPPSWKSTDHVYVPGLMSFCLQCSQKYLLFINNHHTNSYGLLCASHLFPSFITFIVPWVLWKLHQHWFNIFFQIINQVTNEHLFQNSILLEIILYSGVSFSPHYLKSISELKCVKPALLLF